MSGYGMNSLVRCLEAWPILMVCPQHNWLQGMFYTLWSSNYRGKWWWCDPCHIRALYPLDHILVFNHGNERGDVPFVGLNTLRTQACKLHSVQGNANEIFGKGKKEKRM